MFPYQGLIPRDEAIFAGVIMTKIASDPQDIVGGLNFLSGKGICFICGAIKSGTTWIQLLLDAHPEIRCRGEGHLVNVLAKELGQAINNYNKYIHGKNTTIFKEIEGFPLFSQENFHDLCRFSFALLFGQYGVTDEIKIVAEKTPDNIRHLDFLKNLFPESKFIHVIRDGRDVAVSGWYHNLRVTPNWAREKFGNIDAFAENMARNWSREIEIVEAFGEQNPGVMHEIRYEDLLHDPAAELARILEFLGVEASDDIVALCCEKASFESLTGGRRAGHEDQSSHFRKATTGQWREELSSKTLQRFYSIAGVQLERYGYAQ